MSWYVQDTWRIRPRVTLNLGLRWDGIWNPNPGFPILGDLVALGRPRIRNGVLEQRVGPPPQGIPDDLNNWAPRVGVAWDATGDGKTIVRGGLGIYYAPFPTVFMACGVLCGPGFRGQDAFIPFSPVTGMDTLGLNLTYPNTLPPAAPAAVLPLLPPPNTFFADPELESARVFTFQIGSEREIIPNLSISGTYTYNRSQNLRTGGFNTTPWDRSLNPAGVTFDQFGRTVGGFNIPRLVQSINPVTGKPVIAGANVLASFGRARYHAFILQVKKAFNQRYQFNVNYTLSKNKDNASSDRDTDAFFGPSDPFNLDLDFGRSQLDIRHLFRAYGRLLLPADIEVSTIVTGRSGRAFPAHRGFCFPPQPDYRDGFQCSSFILSTIRPALADGSGLLPRFPFRNSNSFNWDVRIGREFRLRPEQVRVRVTFEIFNVTNTNNAFSNTSGVSTNGIHCGGLSPECIEAGVGPDFEDAPAPPRSAQFGLKFIF